MLELFKPSYNTLVSSPLPLSPSLAEQCIAELAELVRTRPASLSARQYNAVYTAFTAGYAKFACGTDDYSSLDLESLKATVESAFAPYTLDVVSAMLANVDNTQPNLTRFCTLTDGTTLYDAGQSKDDGQMVSFSPTGSKAVSLSSAQSMTNSAVLEYV